MEVSRIQLLSLTDFVQHVVGLCTKEICLRP
jgi:hypothetical protein